MLKKKIVAGLLAGVMVMTMGAGSTFAETEDGFWTDTGITDIVNPNGNVEESENPESLILPSPVPVSGDLVNPKKVEKGVTVMGKALDLQAVGPDVYAKNGNLMIPLRAVAEALGYKVEWDNEDRSAELTNEQFGMKIYIGKDSYARYTTVLDAVGMTAPQSFGAAPELVNSVTFVPAKAFELLYYVVEENSSDMGVRISEFPIDNIGNGVELPSPIEEFETQAEAEGASCQSPVIPESLRDREVEGYRVIDGSMFQVDYKDGSYFRMDSKDPQVQEIMDISGDYNRYASTEDMNLDIIVDDVAVKGQVRGSEKGKVKVAVWVDGLHAYCISYGEEVDLRNAEGDVSSVY
ncbi:MAG: copper amine oxidase N-terminal domain-containing protein [Clostridia bacterium]|nr:copper amine oxidase N-terminal domain-containing protein [Clostridia bacterium]